MYPASALGVGSKQPYNKRRQEIRQIRVQIVETGSRPALRLNPRHTMRGAPRKTGNVTLKHV